MNANSSTWYVALSEEGLTICEEFAGKYKLLYNSILKGCLSGDTMGAYLALRYHSSMVSMGSCGKRLGGNKYNSVPLYFLVEVEELL